MHITSTSRWSALVSRSRHNPSPHVDRARTNSIELKPCQDNLNRVKFKEAAMNILVFGAGVVGTAYTWQLSQAEVMQTSDEDKGQNEEQL